jgi:lipoprotein-anchoring transpeptidase ErfK/SrfK
VQHRSRGALLVAFALSVGLTGSACKGETRLSSFVTTTTAKVRVATPNTSAIDGVPAPTRIALAAIATGGAVVVHPTPGSPAVAATFSNPTVEGQPLAFLAVDQQADWLQVRLPERPNGSTGWIKADQVRLAPVENRVVISVSQRSVRVLDKAQQVLFETNVAVGKPRTPTPLGRFYVDIWMPNPGSPYGTFLLSIGGFSEVLKTFGGGVGQVAMHGWSDQSVMGTAASNGCIRMRNTDISRVASLAPLGTPVEIVA